MFGPHTFTTSSSSPLHHTTIRKMIGALSATALLAASGCAAHSNASASAPEQPRSQAPVTSAENTPAPPVTESEEVYEGQWPGLAEADRSLTEDRTISTIYFDYDSAKLDRANNMGLDMAKHWLDMHPDRGLVIIGHADPRGSHAYNQQLAQARAESAASALVNQGVERDRILVTTFGEEELASPSDYSLNRRVVFQTDPANAYGVNTVSPYEERNSTRTASVASSSR